ncbi:MAG: hydrogenase maturation nickel metallochaperone HypA [Candidatus Omnitrophica bacterium]|nr:hydrogenase maturation nickel metallochaperone HypA [Candidatus Omnitrophota bacterium]
MHEIKLTENIVAILEREVASPEVGRVKKVHLEVGRLRYIVPEIMQTAFINIPKSEKLEKAVLEIKTLPLEIKCQTCGAVSMLKDFRSDFICGKCSSEDVKIVSGDEFNITGIEW